MEETSKAASFPSGWYVVGYSEELPPGHVKRVRCFNRTLVLFRTASGDAALLDGFCPHYGFPLGRGKVRGECIECPFHGWLWSTNGSVTKIPYAFGAGYQMRIKSWEVHEVGGLIIAWYDYCNSHSTWTLPGMPELSGSDGGRRVFWEDAQEPIPNRTPREASRLVHSLQRWATNFAPPGPEPSDSGHARRTLTGIRLVPGPSDGWLAPGDHLSAEVELESWGPGLFNARMRTDLFVVTELCATTPVDRERVQLFRAVIASHRGSDGGAGSPEQVYKLVERLRLDSDPAEPADDA